MENRNLQWFSGRSIQEYPTRTNQGGSAWNPLTFPFYIPEIVVHPDRGFSLTGYHGDHVLSINPPHPKFSIAD